MKKRFVMCVGIAALSLAASSANFAQTTTTTTTTVREKVSNGDGTYSVIEYPIDKEVLVNLTPTTMFPNANGTAKIIRKADGTAIALKLSGVSGDQKNYNVYAVDPLGAVTSLGTVAVDNGVGTADLTTPLDKFMLVLSPDDDLTTYDNSTAVVLRSAVPTGYAVVPITGGKNKKVALTAETSAYNAPLLGITKFKGETEVRVKFTGDLEGLKGKAYINSRKDGATQIKMRFADMKLAPKNDRRLVLWAVSPDNQISKLGQVINTGDRQEAEIRSETVLKDFGLFVTLEDKDVEQPTTVIVSDISVM